MFFNLFQGATIQPSIFFIFLEIRSQYICLVKIFKFFGEVPCSLALSRPHKDWKILIYGIKWNQSICYIKILFFDEYVWIMWNIVVYTYRTYNRKIFFEIVVCLTDVGTYQITYYHYFHWKHEWRIVGNNLNRILEEYKVKKLFW